MLLWKREGRWDLLLWFPLPLLRLPRVTSLTFLPMLLLLLPFIFFVPYLSPSPATTLEYKRLFSHLC